MGGHCPRDSGQSRARGHWSAAMHPAGSRCAWPRKSRASQIGVKSIDNDKAPAVPLACTGARCVQLARLLCFPNSARTATAAASAAPGREPSANMAGTAEAASGTATASVRLKAPRSLRGIFVIVSSASDRAAAEGKTD
jgi:hypothetical protein